jgi:hypothetical protein
MSDSVDFVPAGNSAPEPIVINVDGPTGGSDSNFSDDSALGGGFDPGQTTPLGDAGQQQEGDDDIVDLQEYVKSRTEGRFSSLDEILERLDSAPQGQEVQFKDDYIKKAVEYYEQNGTLKPFLEAFNTDYDALTPEQLMRNKLREDYADLSESAFEKLFRREVIEKYNLDEEMNDEEDIELGKQLLSRDAQRIRDEFKKRQDSFLAPSPDSEAELQEQQEMAENWSKLVNDSEFTKQITSEKAITIDIDGEEFNYEIDNPEAVMEMTIDNSKFFNLFLNESGEVDLKKWYKVLAFAMEPDVFENTLVRHGRSNGVTQVEKAMKNPDVPGKSQGVQAAQDWRDAFLSAAINQKKK